MAMNFSHRPIFPGNPSEDNLLSSMRIRNSYVMEGISEKNGDGFGKSRCFNWEIEDSYDYGRDWNDKGGSCEPISNDILDLLPSDPFGMDISATFTAITGWFEDFEADSEECRRDEVGATKGDFHFIAGLNFMWNRAMMFQAVPGNTTIDERSRPADSIGGWVEERQLVGDESCNCGFESVGNVEEFLSFGDEDTQVASCHAKNSEECTGSCSDEDGGVPNEGLLFALGYLGVQELLSTERVCRSLRSAVKSDALLWRNIYIDKPLSERITDDALLQLTSRAQGNLQCLSLMDCSRITDDGLKHVLESNRRLTKLSVPGCTRLSVEGIVNNLKAFNSLSIPGIKHLRIGGLYGVTQKHFQELKLLLGEDKCLQLKGYKPLFFHSGHLSLSSDDDRALDIERCPMCGNSRLVYDCPAESCQGTEPGTQLCRACTLCIARCSQCGRCINDSEYEETFCLDLLCSNCLKQLPRDRMRKMIPPNTPFYTNRQDSVSTYIAED